MTDMHTPTPEFRAGLEAEVVRALHRERESASRFWNPTRSRAAMRIAAGLVLGVALGAAPAQVQDARQRDSLLASAQAEEKLMALRLALVRQELEDALKRVEAGLSSRASLAAAEAQLRQVELAVMTLRTNIEEIKATAAPPRDDISAPAVGGRDFVKERLQFQAAATEKVVAAAEEAAREAERRRSVGVENELAVQQAELDREQAKIALAVVAKKMELRKRFLDSDITASSVERQLRTEELKFALMLAQRRAAVAVDRLERMKEMMNRGLISRADLLRAELEMVERQTEIERIQAQLRAMGSREDGGGEK